MKEGFGNRFWGEFIILLPLSIFRRMKESEVTFREFHQMQEDFLKARNEIFHASISNSPYHFMTGNHQKAFKISVNGNVIIWDDNDSHLGTREVDYDAPPTDDFIAWIEGIVDDYLQGKVHCSDCKKLILKSEIAGGYFAGRYCEDCWERKWRDVAAKETYD